MTIHDMLNLCVDGMPMSPFRDMPQDVQDFLLQRHIPGELMTAHMLNEHIQAGELELVTDTTWGYTLAISKRLPFAR